MRLQLRAAAAGAVLLLAPLGTAPVHATDTLPVTTMTDPGSALDGMFLTYLGCDVLGGPVTAPTTRINRGPATAPLGRRSFGLVPSGPGTASGPTLSFLSLDALGAGVDVHAVAGTTGVSDIWVRTPDLAVGQAWHGRATLEVEPGQWQHVQTDEVRHDWELVDLLSGQATDVQTATPAEFVASHGDGQGRVVTGFGCDGNEFNLDAVRGNGGTWDFEGMSLATAIATSATRLAVGDDLTVAGSVTDPGGRDTGDPLVLQSRVPGSTEWTDVSPLSYRDADHLSQVTIPVTETREFRWLRPESEYADAGASEPVLVTVVAPATG